MELGEQDGMRAQLARTRELEPQFIGLELAAARDLANRLGVQLRIIDSDQTAVTAELRSNRITVDVRTGTVATATAG